MGLGGALGGLGVALGAPALLVRPVELPLVCLATLVVFALSARRSPDSRRLLLATGLGLLLVAAGLLTTAAMALAERGPVEETVLSRSRSVYGTLMVVERPGAQPGETVRTLVDGNTAHGAERLGGRHAGEPTLYYAEETGVGQAFAELSARRSPARVGLIGLGVGTLASYGRSGDTLVFFELDPGVVRVAERDFTYLARSRAAVSVRVGDGRAGLAASGAEPPFDLLVIDAFSSDAIPTHLLTREAMALYQARLAQGGVIAFHVTNRSLDLVGVVEALAKDAGLGARVVRTEGVATWALVASGLPMVDVATAPWTDDHAPLWRAVSR